MKNISINYSYTKEEYVKAVQKYLSISKIFGTTERWILTLTWAITLLLMSRSGITLFTILMGFTMLSITFWFMIIYFVQPKSSYKSALRLTENYTFSFSKEKITFTSDRVTSDFEWKHFKKLYETKDFFFLTQGKNSYTILPKRAFLSTENCEAFKKIAASAKGSMEYIYKE